ncbi:AAA family ATPase [Candidatus Woesearchaeota archaeon]|nr:AAA family ATPase [Candidatus Woesearchaeota archaeon]
MAENDIVAKKESMLLSVTEQIERFKEFFEEVDKKNLLEAVSAGKSSVAVDFARLSSFDPKIAVDLLDYPEEVIKAAELSIKEIELPSSGEAKNYRVRVYNLPESQKLMIRDIRSSHIGKLLVLEGIVRRKSDVRPQVVNTRFECPNCGNIISVLQLEATFKEPHRCGCGRKGNFRLLEKELVDAQSMVLEENPEMLEGGDQPKRIGIFLKEDLVSPISEKKTNPGSRVRLAGVLKDVPVVKHGTRSTSFDLHIDTNYLETIEEDFYDIKISKEDEEAIIALAKDKQVYDKLIASIAPSIYGYEKVKESLLMQLMGGVQKKRSDGIISRGDMHILLVGDPGSGKSQLLKRISVIAPKGRYVSGGGVSGAGITAAVVKDEILGGWSLEAGALVLANNGICSIDEMDKMREEDTGAMHEALEQQCYHYETEIMFADGRTEKMGKFVESLMEQNKAKIEKGINCEILAVPNLPNILTTDFTSVFSTKISRVSRHEAPETFYKITYRNGRSIIVTPEHPVYIAKDGKITTCKAQEILEGMLAPAPRRLPTHEQEEQESDEKMLHNYGLFLGLQCSEGYSYRSLLHRYSEFGISNTNSEISHLAKQVMTEVFGKKPQLHIRLPETNQKAKLALLTTRISSKKAYQQLEQEVPEIMQKAPLKRVPNKVKTGAYTLKRAFLQGFFLGDGYVDQERTGFTTSSHLLADDLQQLMLQLSIYSYIETEQREAAAYYKVIVSGLQSYQRFYEIIPDMDKRKERVRQLVLHSSAKNNDRDVLPHSYLNEIYTLLKAFRVNDGRLNKNIAKNRNAHRQTCWHYLKLAEEKFQKALDTLEKNGDAKLIRNHWCIELKELARALAVSSSSIRNMEKPTHHKHKALYEATLALAEKKKAMLTPLIRKLHAAITGDIRFAQITKVECIPNTECKWTYDITVEPTHTFISQNLVLHNSVSIAKANIQATLMARTTVLAAANPKYGRFDQYGNIAEQINLPPALINRFDLIFTIKDLPQVEKDEKTARHILKLHQTPDINEPEISTKLLKKYISYARQKVRPVLTDAAIDEIKDFYVQLRNREVSDERAARAIPISARQLEALVRMGEASAKVRLSDKVTREDARRAIELLVYCLMQVGREKETGQIDIDRIATGIPASQREKIFLIKQILEELEEGLGKTIPVEDVARLAVERGVSKTEVDEIIEKLKRAGDVYEPRYGFLSRM